MIFGRPILEYLSQFCKVGEKGHRLIWAAMFYPSICDKKRFGLGQDRRIAVEILPLSRKSLHNLPNLWLTDEIVLPTINSKGTYLTKGGPKKI